MLKEKVKEKLSQEASKKFQDWSKHNPFGETKKNDSTRIFKQTFVNDVFLCGEFDPKTCEYEGKVVSIHSSFAEFSNMIQGKKHGKAVRVNKDDTSQVLEYEHDIHKLVE